MIYQLQFHSQKKHNFSLPETIQTNYEANPAF